MKIITGVPGSGVGLVSRMWYEDGCPIWDWASVNKAIGSTNDALIQGMFGKFSYLRPPSRHLIQIRGAGMVDKIQAASIWYKDIVVADPGFCLTLPAWAKFGGKIDALVICCRSPHSVVQSLQGRYWITRRLAYRLWLNYERQLTEELPKWHIPVHYINYDALLDPSSNEEVISHLVRFLEPPIFIGDRHAYWNNHWVRVSRCRKLINPDIDPSYNDDPVDVPDDDFIKSDRIPPRTGVLAMRRWADYENLILSERALLDSE